MSRIARIGGELKDGPKKICRSCKKNLLATAKFFASSASSPDGLYATCRRCICSAEMDIAKRRGRGGFEVHRVTDTKRSDQTRGSITDER